MVGGAVIMVSHSVVSSAVGLVAARELLPVLSGIGRDIAGPEPALDSVR